MQPTTIRYNILPVSLVWVFMNIAAAIFMISEMLHARCDSYSTFINHIYSGFDYDTTPADGNYTVLMQYTTWEAVTRPLIKLALELCIMVAVRTNHNTHTL